MFLILPHQLFESKYYEKKTAIVIWECPHYFNKYNYNKKKLILHRGSMKAYSDSLKKKGFTVKYIEFTKKIPNHAYTMFDPIDKLDLGNLQIILIETPNFLLPKIDYVKYRNKTTHFIFNNFYTWGKKLLNIIPEIKSQDKDNRNKLPNSINIPPTKSLNTKSELSYIKEATTYVEKHFSKNNGNSKDFIYPITHKTCRIWFTRWLEDKFKLFGKYQDAIHNDDSFLFHSVLSTSINIGLINPTDILCILKKYKKKIPINSYEGYVRQLFWREYQRYCYIYYNYRGKNYFGDKKVLYKKWYTGNVGILPVDNCIIRGFDRGYLNHIERLMVIGNYMVLSGIAPTQGFKWFMEMSCDSYEWVMSQNVLDMVFFVSGGITMRRPYISSSNYILKMSNYKREPWCDVWDNLYDKFKKEKKNKLWKFRYFFKGLK
jgi:deoxyribodipyrimidine photolyase-related protein